MSSMNQATVLKKAIGDIGFYPYISQKVNRKGTDVAIMGWIKSYDKYKKLQAISSTVKSIS